MRTTLTRLRAKRRNTSYEPGENLRGSEWKEKEKGVCGRLRRNGTVFCFFVFSVSMF